jgi:hypothetical protein
LSEATERGFARGRGKPIQETPKTRKLPIEIVERSKKTNDDLTTTIFLLGNDELDNSEAKNF